MTASRSSVARQLGTTVHHGYNAEELYICEERIRGDDESQPRPDSRRQPIEKERITGKRYPLPLPRRIAFTLS